MNFADPGLPGPHGPNGVDGATGLMLNFETGCIQCPAGRKLRYHKNQHGHNLIPQFQPPALVEPEDLQDYPVYEAWMEFVECGATELADLVHRDHLEIVERQVRFIKLLQILYTR